MRTQDKHKLANEKASRTINFEVSVLRTLEKRARQENTKVNYIVNRACKLHVMQDRNYYREIKKHYYMLFKEYEYLEEECIKKENGTKTL